MQTANSAPAAYINHYTVTRQAQPRFGAAYRL